MTDKPRIPMTDDEHALLDTIRRTFPYGHGVELDGPKDRALQELGKRLIDAAVIERVEQTVMGEDGVEWEAANYRLTEEFVKDDLGGTPDPSDN